MPKAIIFDMDGLLLDTEILSFQSFVTTASHHRFIVSIDDYRQMIGLNAASGIDILLRIITAHLAAKDFKDAWLAVYKTLLEGDVAVKVGAFSFLTHLENIGMPRAVATSSSGAKARMILQKTGLLRYIPHVTGGDEVAAGKPAPDVYLDAAGKLGIDPGNCLALEDSSNGVTAALAAGMTVIQIPDLAPPHSPADPPRFHLAKSLHAAASMLGLGIQVTKSNNP